MNQVAFLGEAGWDFPGASSDPLSAIHPYPAKFIPSIPLKLIQEFRPPEGTVLLDPFCGSGTTLTVAQAAGIPSLGVDLNPIAVLMTRVKTAPIPEGVERTLARVDAVAREECMPVLPDIPRLDHWFKPQVQAALASLTAAIERHGDSARELLRLALSSVIVRVSNQDSDTRYAAVKKSVGSKDVFDGFGGAVRRITKALSTRQSVSTPAEVIEADVLTLDRKVIGQPVGLVITSPPYPNAYEYWLYHKYRMWWLGFDPLAVKAREIGARAHFFKGRNSHTAQDFERQMTTVMAMLASVMVEGGHTCFVMGRSKIRGELVDNAAIIARAGKGCGFDEVMRAERVIAPTRKSFNLSHANIKTETVLVMRKSR